jgi:hypothetical protein
VSAPTYKTTQDPAIARYRHRWLDTLVTHNQIQAVIALGGLANTAFHTWRNNPSSAPYDGAYEHILHPTSPTAPQPPAPTHMSS